MRAAAGPGRSPGVVKSLSAVNMLLNAGANPDEIQRAGFHEGQMVSLVHDAGDGVHREVGSLKVTPFKLPDGASAPIIRR